MGVVLKKLLTGINADVLVKPDWEKSTTQRSQHYTSTLCYGSVFSIVTFNDARTVLDAGLHVPMIGKISIILYN